MQFHQISKISKIKIENYLNWRIFNLGTEFIFLILQCSYIVVHYECKNTLILAFYLSYLKDCFFFCSLEKLSWCVPAKYSKINNTEQCPRRNEKHISNIHFAVNFCIAKKLLFHLIFIILVSAQILRTICWGKLIKGT